MKHLQSYIRRLQPKGLKIIVSIVIGILSMCPCIILKSGEYDIVANEQRIVIITASYNNARWCVENVKRTLAQKYTNFHLIYIDDASTDDTWQLVSEYLSSHSRAHQVTLIHNDERRGAVANQYMAISLCAPSDIIIIYDGDDFFAHNMVLARINEAYQDPAVWITYGQFIYWPSKKLGMCRPFPVEVLLYNTFRDYEWISSHLRTFRAGLAQRVHVADIQYNGEFMKMTGDIAYMLPMLEMARDGHIRYIDEVLLWYNAINELNDCRTGVRTQLQLEHYIRALPRYAMLTML